ncbi:unnamed protein product, partial [Durusdinium trenchii]
MLNQVLHSISTLHNARAGPDPTYNWSMSVDANMDETEHGWTAAEIRQMKRDYYEEDDPQLANNPWRIHQNVKPGQAQLIADAWKKHERDRRLVSLSAKEVNEIYEGQWMQEMTNFQNETFILPMLLGSDNDFTNDTFVNEQLEKNARKSVCVKVKPKHLVTEVYTTTER